MEKITKEQEAQIYCIKNGHANFVWKFWGYIYCGRCGKQIGDQLASIFDTRDLIVIGCKDKNCKVCKPLIKKLSILDSIIFKRLEKASKKGLPDYNEILKDIDFKKRLRGQDG